MNEEEKNGILSILKKDNSLKKLMDEFQSEFSIFILYESGLLDDIDKKHFHIKKKKSVEENLSEVLAGTKLKFSKISNTTYVIVRKYNDGFIYGQVSERGDSPLTGANVSILNKNTGAVTDLSGKYLLRQPPGEYILRASYVGFQPLEKEITIEAGDSTQLNFDLLEHATLREVVIVGSHFSPTSLLEKTEPAEVVNAARMNQSGHQSVGQMLQYAVPSFHSTAQTVSDGTDHISPATLRGLGPDQVLVLINGKRRHSSALVNINGTVGRGTVATDLNAIPASAIEKIEVLRDGAAVQYGSDAIAGVINIVLKKQHNFTEVNTFAGGNQAGDGRSFQLNGSHGLSIGKGGGFAQFTFDFRHKGHINRSGEYTGPVFGDSREKSPESLSEFFAQTGFDGHRVMSIGGAASTDAGGFFNMELPVIEKVKAYAFGGANYRMGESFGFYRFPYQKQRQSGLYPFGFSPKIQADIFDRSLTVGLKSERAAWQLDLSNTSGSNRFDFSVHNSNNASMGLASPTSAEAGGFQYSQNVTNLNVDKKLKWHVPLHLGFGAEFRLEKFEQLAGEEVSWENYGDKTESGLPKEAGFQVFPGFRPENETRVYRYNIGVFTHLEINVSPQFLLSGAGRYEQYSDFGSHLIWKVGGRYLIKEKVAIRGTYNTGFRAPSVPQENFSSRAFQFVSIGGEQHGIELEHFKNSSQVARQFGIQNLQAEQSKNASVGIAAQLLDNLSVTLDAFRIDIRDRIVLTGHVSEDDDPRFAEILRPVGVSKAQFFTNAISTRTQGLDLVLKHDWRIRHSILHFSIAGNFTQTKLKTNAEGLPAIHVSEVLHGFENVLFNREEIARIEVAQPRSKVIAHVLFSHKKLKASITATRFGEVKYVHPDDGQVESWVVNSLSGERESRDQVFSPKWVSDFNVGYRCTPGISLSLGGNNVFDVYPDEHRHSANISNGLFRYSRRVQQFGVEGAFWYARVNFRF